MNVIFDCNLKPYHTFGMEVYAHRYVECMDVEEIRRLLTECRNNGEPLFVMGGGSNLLFVDNVPGTVLRPCIKSLEIVRDTIDTVWIRCGAGMVWDDLVAQCVKQGWYGVENLSYIPGEVGASAIQNIGAYGVEVKDLITEVEAIEITTGLTRRFTNEECEYAYRQSIFKRELRNKYVVTHVTYRLSKQQQFTLSYGNVKDEIKKRGLEVNLDSVRNVIIAIRKQKLPDPEVFGNAGSFFMNPIVERTKLEFLQKEYTDIPFYPIDDNRVKLPAGWLIEKAGWKGRSLGCAGVHHAQALVLVNLGGASGDEVVRLAETVAEAVNIKFGVKIQREVNIVKGGRIE